jgi:protein-S-isoprenylcysteine O-methyltransferase
MTSSRGTMILIVAWVASEIALAFARRSGDRTAESLDRSSLRVLWITISLSVTAAIMLAGRRFGAFGTGWTDWGRVGVVLILAGLALRWWAILTLRHAFTVDVAVASGQSVIESGPYAFVRHPSYTGILLSFAGLGLLLRHWTSVVALLVPITWALLYRIGIEERALVAGLGEAYADFMRRRKRLVPFVY